MNVARGMVTAMDGSAISERLAAAGCLMPGEEARELLASAPEAETLEDRVRRREQGEPLAWIVGATTFCGHRIAVRPGVYVPRPQTETLARRASALLPDRGSAVDLCTGSGAIGAHLLRASPMAHVIGVDVDERSVACARDNGLPVVRADLERALHAAAFDVVTAVAPYVPSSEIAFLPLDVQRYEPRLMIDGGPDGLDVVRRVALAAARLLRPGGWFLTELGGRQDRLLAPTLATAGFGEPDAWFDEEGDLRGVAAQSG